jgi:DNA-binding transcriptional LysR family regulator
MPQKLAQRLTVRHLRLIAAIADQGQLSLAARALSLTQPAASRMLGEIELLCGDALFERHPRGMTLTPTGELMTRRARNVLEEIAGAAAEVARHRSGLGGTVRVGAVTGGAVGYVVPAIRRLRGIAPDAEVHVEVAMSRELIRGLEAVRLDFVLARIPPESDPGGFDVVPASEEQIDLVVGTDSPFASRRSVGLTELLELNWVMQARGAPIRVAIENAILAAGAPLPARITNTSSLLVTLAMLDAPDSVAPVSREVSDLVVGVGPRAGVVRLPLAERIVVAPYLLISTRGRRLSPLAQRFHDMVAEMLTARAS